MSVLPPEDVIERASALKVFGADGNEITFGSIFEKERTVIVFIRHFFCGRCQAYVSQLASVSPDALTRAKTRIVVIGCGEWAAIKDYAEMTGFRGEIYANPDRELYRALGMTVESLNTTPAGEQKRSYLSGGMFSNAMSSIWRGPVKRPNLIGKQGNLSQLGGDFIFGPGNQCTFSSKMKHTEDHIEVKDLMNKAGVEE